ncbi:AsnC family transcriptional regulator [Streptomyces albofaciens]|uniref:AsnC family transcriptional regulator n=1 Tax=Streptomyces albofaciens TaxID=66866 RepID=UPI001FCCA8FA|nr:AsnC family transcriptional regulator [Streptomyces albofaciens]
MRDTSPLGLRDQRLIAALQCDGRLSAERAAEVLGENPRTVHRRWRALTGDGTVKVVAVPVRPDSVGALFLRIKVLKGKLDALTAALAARPDVPFIDLSASGDEITAVSLTEPGSRDHLVFRQLPATPAVASVSAATVLHVFAEASDWRHDVLTPEERAALTLPPGDFGPPGGGSVPDPVDRDIMAALQDDARTPAAAIAARTGHPASTVRRRLARLMADGRLSTQVVVDPKRLGLHIDANVMMQVPPDHLNTVGRALARHPAVHGAFATTGAANLHAAVWVRDLAALYRLITHDLTGLGISGVETVLVGHAVKRPGR